MTSEYSCTESVQILRCHPLYLIIYVVYTILQDELNTSDFAFLNNPEYSIFTAVFKYFNVNINIY